MSVSRSDTTPRVAHLLDAARLFGPATITADKLAAGSVSGKALNGWKPVREPAVEGTGGDSIELLYRDSPDVEHAGVAHGDRDSTGGNRR